MFVFLSSFFAFACMYACVSVPTSSTQPGSTAGGGFLVRTGRQAGEHQGRGNVKYRIRGYGEIREETRGPRIR